MNSYSVSYPIAGKPAPTGEPGLVGAGSPAMRSSATPLMCALALAISLSGCAGLPDQRLANEALKNGDTATAERNYRQLAELGYSEAQVGLADIQVGSGDPARLKQAEATYRAAAATSSRAQARLGRLLAAKPDASEDERHEAEALLKQAFASGEGNTLIPLAMLYLQYPQSFPRTNAQQQIDQWRAAGYPEAGLAQVLLYRTQGSYDQHLDEVERICKAALTSTDICYVELATVYQKRAQPEQQAALLEQLKSAYQRGVIPASTRATLSTATSARPTKKPPRPCSKTSPRRTRRPGSAWRNCSTTSPNWATASS